MRMYKAGPLSSAQNSQLYKTASSQPAGITRQAVFLIRRYALHIALVISLVPWVDIVQ
jgi:hypothetical protein